MKTGAEAIRALATQLPVFRQKLSDGWYQVRIAGRDVSTSGLTAQLHETLPDGAVIHIVPRVAGAKSGGVFQIVLGAAAIAGSFFTAGATLAAWGAAIGAGGMTGILFSLGASMVLGVFRQKLSDGWYQVRIAGRDVSTSGLTAQLHETLPDGAVIHIVPRVAGAKSGGVFQIVLGAAAIAGSFFTAGATLAAWGAAIGAGGMTGILFSLGASMVLGGVAQMLAPKARTPRTQTTDNGKQNTYFSSLDNMVAQGNVLPVLYGEMRVGSRVVSQEISTADEGDGGQVVVIGR